jgi:ribosomal protein S18 acetylase RimI-like enzyme
MSKIFGVAVARGCSRVEWTTDQNNPDARHFYARLGFPIQSSKVRYRVEGPDVVRAAERLNVGPALDANDQVEDGI